MRTGVFGTSDVLKLIGCKRSELNYFLEKQAIYTLINPPGTSGVPNSYEKFDVCALYALHKLKAMGAKPKIIQVAGKQFTHLHNVGLHKATHREDAQLIFEYFYIDGFLICTTTCEHLLNDKRTIEQIATHTDVEGVWKDKKDLPAKYLKLMRNVRLVEPQMLNRVFEIYLVLNLTTMEKSLNLENYTTAMSRRLKRLTENKEQ